MSEEFEKNSFEEEPVREENAQEPFAPEEEQNTESEIIENEIVEEVFEEKPFETAEEEIPEVHAEPANQQQFVQQQFGQPQYGNPDPDSAESYQQMYRNFVQNQNAAAEAPKKSNKGAKIFIIVVAAIALLAVIAGGISVLKYTVNRKSNGYSASSEEKGDASLNINESPVTPTKTNKTGPLSTTEIAAKVRESNVGILVYRKNSTSTAGEGSGIIMGEDSSKTYTYIITCAHVIKDKGVTIAVQTEDGTAYDAEIVGYDIRTDIGVLKIKAKGLSAAEFGDSNALSVGDPVYAVGNPGGVEFFGSFTGGYVASIDRPISSEIGYTMKCIQHSAAINPGNSGGALANQYGQVIGINSQKIASTEYEGIGFAIPITYAKSIVDNLIKVGYVPDRPKLGITYYPLSASTQYSMIARIKGLPSGSLIINEISSDSSLANTEVRQYDLITKVDGKDLTTADVLLELVDNGKVGDKHKLTICRIESNYEITEFEVEFTLVEDKGTVEEEETTYRYIDPFEFFGNFGY